MMSARRAAVLSGCLVFLLAADAQAGDYRAEAQQIAREIADIHPRGREIESSADYIAARDALLAMAGDADLPHYAIALGRMFHAANDGHTAAIPLYGDAPEFKFAYPLKLKRFEDGIYVVEAKGDAAPLLGARLTRIAGKRVEEILRDFVKAQASGNRAWPANWTPVGLARPGWLIGLDVIPNDLAAPVRFEGVDRKGRRVSAILAASADGEEGLAALERKKAPLETLKGEAGNYTAEIAEGRALTLVIGAMEDSDAKSFEAFTAEAAAAVNTTKAERLIIDLRDNGGGNNMLAEPLRRTIVKSRFNRPGGVYVLISPQTFSAAMNFATRLERETDALFAGEPTGGAPNHFGDAKFAHGSVSGVPYIISTLRWQDSTPFDEREWILPDLPTPPAFRDYLSGRDRALDAALTNDVPAAENDWRERVVKPWARPSQKAEWRFFYEQR
jgi:hypothetical protein